MKRGELGYEVPLLAFITAIVYFMASLYQSGYAAFYGYDSSFIGLDLNAILNSFLSIVYAGIIVCAGMIVVGKIQKKKFGNSLFIMLYVFISPLLYLVIINNGTMWLIYSYDVYVKAAFILLAIIVAMYLPTTFKISLDLNKKISMSGVLSNAAMIVFVSSPIGTVSAASQGYFYQKVGSNYYLLASGSGSNVYGACNESSSTFKVEKNDVPVEYIRVSSPELVNKIKRCFHDSVLLNERNQGNKLPEFRIHVY